MEDNKQTLLEVLEELKKDDINTELIQDNKLHFRYKEDIYRVRLPNQKENSDATNYKNKQYIKLLQEDNTLTLKQLKKVLIEKQDIDIDKLDEQAKTLEDEMTQLYLTLSKKKNSETKSIQELKDKINKVRDKRVEIVLEKAGYLAPAIENQVQDDYYRFLTAICTEKLTKVEDTENWNRVWNTYSDYEKDDSKLLYIALGRFTELFYGA
jgi:biopolymer transport protein ExbD